MIPLLLAACAGAGVYLLVTRSRSTTSPTGALLQARITDAGYGDIKPVHLAALVACTFAAGGVAGFALFGTFSSATLVGLFVATFPVAAARGRARRRQSDSVEAWPRLIEEIRLLCGSLGRPIPQALLEVGKRGPDTMRPAFLEAEREWLMTTDFERTIAVLKHGLADPTADATCETLLIAHNVGGTELDKRLAALAEDRYLDLQGRKDAKAKQTGVQFARRFVLIVPVGMAMAGLSIGNGRAAYESTGGQIGVACGLGALAACWWWAGTLIRLPEEQRVQHG